MRRRHNVKEKVVADAGHITGVLFSLPPCLFEIRFGQTRKRHPLLLLCHHVAFGCAPLFAHGLTLLYVSPFRIPAARNSAISSAIDRFPFFELQAPQSS